MTSSGWLSLPPDLPLLVDDDVVSDVGCPVFPPDRRADEVLDFLRAQV